MRKALFALCTAMLIFINSMFTPVAVSAAQNTCPPHTFNATYSGFHTETDSHYYYGLNCVQTKVFTGDYPRCTGCGFIDYDHPYKESLHEETHSVCGYYYHE